MRRVDALLRRGRLIIQVHVEKLRAIRLDAFIERDLTYRRFVEVFSGISDRF